MYLILVRWNINKGYVRLATKIKVENFKYTLQWNPENDSAKMRLQQWVERCSDRKSQMESKISVHSSSSINFETSKISASTICFSHITVGIYTPSNFRVDVCKARYNSSLTLIVRSYLIGGYSISCADLNPARSSGRFLTIQKSHSTVCT